MKNLLLVLLMTIFLPAFSQNNLPDNFKIENAIEIFSGDSLKIHFDCMGQITNDAQYYRVGKIGINYMNVGGPFTDYYLNGAVYLKATMNDQDLEGKASYFYPDGRTQEQGYYHNHERVGNWTYYYQNGQVDKVMNFDNEVPLIMEAYSKEGKATVINGNGKTNADFGWCGRYFNVKGEVVNGKLNGVWEIKAPGAYSSSSSETYVEGKFIKGLSGTDEYFKKSTIKLTKYNPSENLFILNGTLYSENYGEGQYISLQYKNTSVKESLYPELLNWLKKYNDSYIKNQWLLVNYKIDDHNRISDINVASSINDINIESYVFSFMKKTVDWQTVKFNSSKIITNNYLTILVFNNQFVIAPYQASSHY